VHTFGIPDFHLYLVNRFAHRQLRLYLGPNTPTSGPG